MEGETPSSGVSISVSSFGSTMRSLSKERKQMRPSGSIGPVKGQKGDAEFGNSHFVCCQTTGLLLRI